MPTKVVFTMLSPQDIQEALAPTLAALGVERAILYGSYVNGKPHPCSDLDLVLIKETDLDSSERYRECFNPLWEALYEAHQKLRPQGVSNYPASLDLTLVTPAEWESQSRRPTLTYEKATKQGVIIYDAARKPALV